MCGRLIDHLTAETMGGFATYLTIDLCQRSGRRGRRQDRAMVGMFSARLTGTQEIKLDGKVVAKRRVSHGLRGSDFSLRVALLVHGWHKVGMQVLTAAEKVAEDYKGFLCLHLGKGKRGKRCSWGKGTELDETVRTIYYKFIGKCPEIDVLLEIWLWYYFHWLDWVVSVDEAGIELTVQKYIEQDQPESAKAFRKLATSARQKRNCIELSFPRTRIHQATREERYEEIKVNGERLLYRLD